MKDDVYRARRGSLRRLVKRKGVGYFLVTSLTNVRYLCGFTGSNGILLLTPDEEVFVSDGRYGEQAESQVTGCRIVILEQVSFVAGLARTIRELVPQRLGFEPQSMSVLFHQRLHQQLRGKVRSHAFDGLVESIRAIKSSEEVKSMRRAARIVDLAFRAFLSQLPVGITEREAQWRLLSILRDLGSERDPFEPIILFGARSSLPHGQSGDRKLKRGDWILMDFGATAEGYCSDFTRTVVKGRATDDMRAVHQVVRKAQNAAVRAVRPRVQAKTVDAAARRVIETAGYGREFSHGLGHGVGVEVHEGPRLGQRSRDVLRSGMVVTIEPGVYIRDWGGIRIEDTLLVTAKAASRLTRSTRELVEV